MATSPLGVIFGAIGPDAVSDDDDLEARKTVLRVGVQAVKAGLAVVVDRPGEKAPMCPLTARDRKAADQAAVDEAVLAGRPRAEKQRHACGLHHAFTDPAEAMKALGRLVKRDRINLGIEPRRSRLIIVDCDDPAQLAAFKAAAGPLTELTVASPGQIGEHGDPADETTWAHYGGGHVYYRVPDGVELPTSTGMLADESGWVAIWGEKQVLIPPSKRREGAYRWIGDVYPAPAWLLARIEKAGQEKAHRIEASRAKRESGGATDVDAWAAEAPWSELLSELGWTDTGGEDNCSCPVWTAPGDHGSPKSATAHEPGCSRFDCERGHGPLYIWTDDPQCPAIEAAMAAYDSKTLTKPQVATHSRFGGSMSKLHHWVEAQKPLPELPPHPDDVPADEPVPEPVRAPEPQAAPVPGALPNEGPDNEDEEADGPAAGLPGPPPVIPGLDGEAPVNLPEHFWAASPALEHIRQAAHSRGRGADGVLLAVLCRLASIVHHRSSVDIGMGPASLNLIGMLVGGPGVGKSTSMELADELIELPADLQMGGWGSGPIGTGEGLIELYWGMELIPQEDAEGNAKPGRPKKERKQVRHNAYTFHDEAEGLFVAAGRKDATLLTTMRTMWSGQGVGQSNASQENTRRLDRRDYAWGALLGIQPAKAGALFDDSAGGTPQRFLFAEVTDPTIPQVLPEHPGVLRRAGGMMRRGQDPAPVALRVPESIAAQVRQDQVAKSRGDIEANDELDAHRVLVVMKLAALLAILFDEADRLSVAHWQLAETIWQTSIAVRARTAEAVRGARIEEARAQDERERRLHVWKADSVETARVERGTKLVTRVASKLGRKVWAEGECARRQLRDAVSSRDVAEHPVNSRAALLEDALSEAVSMGYVAADETGRRYLRGPVQPEQL